MSWTQSSSSSGTTSAKSSVILSKVMDLENVKVSFTQDDIKYYFEITAKSSVAVSSESYYFNRHPSPLLYKNENFANGMVIEESKKAPYASCNNGEFFTTSNVKINGTTISKQEDNYRLLGGNYYDEGSTNIENGDKYFIANSMRPSVMKSNENFSYASKYPIKGTNNGKGVEILSDGSKSDISYNDESKLYKYYAGMDVKISIEKDKIDDYRYLCFAEAFVTITLKAEYDSRASYEGESYCTNTIDLKDYINCDHLWKYEIKDKANHKMVCDKCKWEKDESHNFQYEYDGLKNNLCICRLNKNVNHHFIYDSDKLDDKIVKLVASSSCTTYEDPIKTGYIFKNYEQYYKCFENMTNPVFSTTATKLTDTLKGTITILPTMSDVFSQIFKAKYEPIKYSVFFKANSNLGFNVSLTGINNLNNISYDIEHKVPSVSYAGYTFKGWSLTSGSSTVNLKTTDKIKNLTTTNDKTINLYPVFDKNKYIFKFSKENNIGLIINNNISDLVCEYGKKYNLPNNIEITGYIFKGWTLTKGSTTINLNPKAEIYNYTNDNNKEYLLYPVYEPIKYSVVFKSNTNLGFDINLTSISNLNSINYDTEHNVPTASHIGYIFKGWSLTTGSSTVNLKTTDKIKNLTTTNGKTINLYPVFDKNKYIFKFATESNIDKIIITQNITNLSCEYGNKYNLPNNIEVTGYIFNGWTKTKGSSNIDFSPKAEIFNYTAINNQSIMLYPVYEAIKYNVIFNEESNFKFKIDLTDINNLKDIEYDTEYNVPVAFFTGYTFKGWSFTLGSSKVDIKEIDKIKNLTSTNGKTFNAYPVFDKNKYIFKYATKSNIDKIIITEEIEDLNCEYDTKYNLSNNVKITGYNFVGWSLINGSDKISFNSEAEIFNYTEINNEIITIYPIYEPIKYKFKFSNENLNGLIINGNIEDEEYIYDIPKKLKKNIEVAGYKFIGWSLDVRSTNIDIAPEQEIFNYTTIDNEEIVVYPVYSPMKYVFKFKEDNNVKKTIVNKINDLECIIDKKYNLPNNIDIEGYNFKGWTLTKGSDDINFVPNEEIYNYNIELLYDNMEINLYPIYEPIKYKFKFSNINVDDISIDRFVEDEEFIYDIGEKELYDAINVRGYNFIGWSLSNADKKIDFKPRQKIFNYTNINNKEFILYPVYEPLKINIVYNTNLGNFNDKNKIATISYIVNDMKDFDYPSIYANKKYNRWGELYKSDYLEFSGYKFKNKVFNNFDEFKEYILDRGVQNDNIVLVYNGEVKTKYYKVEHYDDSDNDYVDFDKGPLKPASNEIIYYTTEMNVETLDNTLEYMYEMESTFLTYSYNIDKTTVSRKKVDRKEKEVVEEESETENSDESEEIRATLSIANKWNNDKDIENINRFEMMLMIIRHNPIQFIAICSLFLIILVAYEIIVYKNYRRKVIKE